MKLDDLRKKIIKLASEDSSKFFQNKIVYEKPNSYIELHLLTYLIQNFGLSERSE